MSMMTELSSFDGLQEVMSDAVARVSASLYSSNENTTVYKV